MPEFNVFSLFQSNMVLQRQKPIHIWGTAPKNTTVTVQLNNHTASDTVSDINWHCILPPMEAGEGYTITITCSSTPEKPIILSSVSIGDVWLAGGQSNMEYFLRYDENWEKVKNYPRNPKIHMYNVPQLAFEGHSKNTDGYGTWFTQGDSGFETFSAPGFSFAYNIQPHIHVPVGIIGCNWGGTSASAWLDEAYLKKDPLSIYLKEYEQALSAYSQKELEQLSYAGWKHEDSLKHIEEFMPIMYGQQWEDQLNYVRDHSNDPVVPLGPWSINRPGGLYHQMLEPLIPFSIKGVLWYQGESDAYHAEMYDDLFSTMIKCWREKWNDNFPFLFVQLAPFGKWIHCVSDRYHEVRAKQEYVSKTIPDTGMVSIMDIGSYYDIHPKKKIEVGRRLALLARGKVYQEDILCESPELTNAKRGMNSNELLITFDHCQQLQLTSLDTAPLNRPMPHEQNRFKGCLNDSSTPSCNKTIAQMESSIQAIPTPMFTQIISTHDISGFVLTQNDKQIPIDTIRIKGNSVILTSNALTTDPCTLSLAWADYAEINLVNEAGLPVKPFHIHIS